MPVPMTSDNRSTHPAHVGLFDQKVKDRIITGKGQVLGIATKGFPDVPTIGNGPRGRVAVRRGLELLVALESPLRKRPRTVKTVFPDIPTPVDKFQGRIFQKRMDKLRQPFGIPITPDVGRDNQVAGTGRNCQIPSSSYVATDFLKGPEGPRAVRSTNFFLKQLPRAVLGSGIHNDDLVRFQGLQEHGLNEGLQTFTVIEDCGYKGDHKEFVFFVMCDTQRVIV